MQLGGTEGCEFGVQGTEDQCWAAHDMPVMDMPGDLFRKCFENHDPHLLLQLGTIVRAGPGLQHLAQSRSA